LEEKDYKTALSYFEKSLKLREELGDKRSIAMSYNSLGACNDRMNNLDKALELYDKCLALNTQINDKEGMGRALGNIGNLYLRRNNIAKAYELFNKAFQLANEIGYIPLKRDAAFSLYKVCKLKGDDQKALSFHELYIEIKDKLASEENKKALISSEFKLAYEKKEQTLKLEQEKKEIIHQQEALRKQSDLNKQKAITYGFMAGFVLLIALVVLVFRNLKQSKLANAIISEQKLVVENKNMLIEAKQKEIVDSINYAKRIQYTLLAHTDFLNQNLPEHFIYFNPKDIVSGDFYWATKVVRSNNRELVYLAVCDSTGHGVPGAFMSLLNISFLNEAINEKEIIEPNLVFEHVRKRLIENISKEGQKDGFDGVLLCLEHDGSDTNNTLKLSYAAANNSPVIVRGNDLIQLQNDRMPVGMGEKMDMFNLYQTELRKNDMLYVFTDGFADQFGGEKGKKFKYKQLTEKLQNIAFQSVQEQNERLQSIFENWRGKLEQVDDVCIIGIRL
jgi:serine phosphatase RsbU (regulator of sigma subunit)